MDFIGRDQVNTLIGPNYDRVILTSNTATESEEAYRVVGDIREVIKRYYPEEGYLLGGTATILDMRDTVRADDRLVDKLALLSIGLVLLLNFGL